MKQKWILHISGQRESFFQSRDENENFSDSIAHMETDREFLTLNLRLRDETEKKSPPISGIETRFIIFFLRLPDENENSIDLISVFETRTRILKAAIFL